MKSPNQEKVDMEKLWNRIYSLDAYNKLPYADSGAIMRPNSSSRQGNQTYLQFVEAMVMTQMCCDIECFHRDGMSFACISPRSASNIKEYHQKLFEAMDNVDFYTQTGIQINEVYRIKDHVETTKKHEEIIRDLKSFPHPEKNPAFETISQNINGIIEKNKNQD